MADRSSSVRVLQHHLRQAGERLSAGDLEAAAAQVDAALAVDPASLAALTLRNRLLRARSVAPAVFDVSRPATAGDAHAEFPSESAPAPRFVPSGVDPQSWMSFEGRIEERRFRSLLKSAHEAVRRRDAISARIAIEEARDLRPDAPEVSDLSYAIAALPLAMPPADTVSFLRSRTVRAAGMLVFGVTVMLALDWMRSDPSGTSIDGTWALGRAGESDIVASTSRTGTDAVRLDRMPGEPAGRIEIPAEPALVPATAASGSASRAGAAPAAAPAAGRTTQTARTLAPAGAGRPALAAAVPAPSPSPVLRDTPDAAASNRVIVEAAVTSTPAPSNNTAPLPSREVDDDYVAVPQVTARSTVSAPVPVPPPSTTATTGATARETGSNGSAANMPLGSVVRGGSTTGASAGTLVGGARGNTSADAGAATRAGSTSGSAVAPTPAPAAAAAAAASAAGAVVPRDERNQVMTTVQSYTRALERFDTRAVREVWPTVDERELGRGFTEVESQTFTFSAPCSIDVQGARATASCRGTAKYVVKFGNREPRTEPRTWGFQLTRSGEDWVIDNVRVAR